ncbi:MAG: hypothetical protein BWY75_02863 [bacterium ADurb.Bin425]|nr:MAG: hypothetical protein BWY75_02863 [bacterium ADurb.Bin425]
MNDDIVADDAVFRYDCFSADAAVLANHDRAFQLHRSINLRAMSDKDTGLDLRQVETDID